MRQVKGLRGLVGLTAFLQTWQPVPPDDLWLIVKVFFQASRLSAIEPRELLPRVLETPHHDQRSIEVVFHGLLLGSKRRLVVGLDFDENADSRLADDHIRHAVSSA